ncbi:hypothetical protein HK099_001354, partial [Clydaea vesicula]
DNWCWYYWDRVGTTEEAFNNLPSICHTLKFETSPYTYASWIVQVWFKTITDLFLGLWLLKLLLNSKKISKVFKSVMESNQKFKYINLQENNNKNKKKKNFLKNLFNKRKEEGEEESKNLTKRNKFQLERVRLSLVKFLIIWMGLVLGIVVVYTINRIPNENFYSLNKYSNFNIIEVVNAVLQIFRSLELLIYFKYMDILKSIVGIGAIKISTGVTQLSSVDGFSKPNKATNSSRDYDSEKDFQDSES